MLTTDWRRNQAAPHFAGHSSPGALPSAGPGWLPPAADQGRVAPHLSVRGFTPLRDLLLQVHNTYLVTVTVPVMNG